LKRESAVVLLGLVSGSEPPYAGVMPKRRPFWLVPLLFFEFVIVPVVAETALGGLLVALLVAWLLGPHSSAQ
jgi:hypothetical protein